MRARVRLNVVGLLVVVVVVVATIGAVGMQLNPYPVQNHNIGEETFYLAAAATTNATSVKGAPGVIYDVSATNTTATVYYLRLYNLAAAPACNSATGFVESVMIPANTAGAGIARTHPDGRNYSTGIAFCVTANAASNDNNAAATGVLISLGYK